MIDPQIGITIRQVTSGSVNLIIILPLLTLFGGGDLATTYQCVGQAFADIPSVFFFVASGFFAYTSFSNWYRGNSMCGTALGMACNGTYSFFVPLCSWIIGLIMGTRVSPARDRVDRSPRHGRWHHRHRREPAGLPKEEGGVACRAR